MFSCSNMIIIHMIYVAVVGCCRFFWLIVTAAVLAIAFTLASATIVITTPACLLLSLLGE